MQIDTIGSAAYQRPGTVTGHGDSTATKSVDAVLREIKDVNQSSEADRIEKEEESRRSAPLTEDRETSADDKLSRGSDPGSGIGQSLDLSV